MITSIHYTIEVFAKAYLSKTRVWAPAADEHGYPYRAEGITPKLLEDYMQGRMTHGASNVRLIRITHETVDAP